MILADMEGNGGLKDVGGVVVEGEEGDDMHVEGEVKVRGELCGDEGEVVLSSGDEDAKVELEEKREEGDGERGGFRK